MKIKHLFPVFCTTLMLACSSPEERSNTQIDTNTISPEDTAGKDTVTNINGRSGDNGTGTDTTNTAEQKAIREAGEN